MQSQKYRGYDVRGHAIVEQNGGNHQPERYAASGTIPHGGKLVQVSGVLGTLNVRRTLSLLASIGPAPGSMHMGSR
ncbi:hypothetical protein C8K19_106289 [Paraburkholderia sp. GV072]|nr:hypothetical protein C8K19_106289 [Paraburkholderia sp. GV072]